MTKKRIEPVDPATTETDTTNHTAPEEGERSSFAFRAGKRKSLAARPGRRKSFAVRGRG